MATHESTTVPIKRIGRRIALWLAVFAIGVAGSVAVFHATTLRGLPDIPEPFDLAKYGTIDVPQDQNAFTFYLRAVERLGSGEPQTMRGAYTDWSVVDATQLKWLESNREALRIWLEGTKRDRSLYRQPGTGNFETILTAVQESRTLFRLASLKAFRLEHDGNLAESWVWLRANLRASRHLGQNGSVIERLIGVSAYVSGSLQVKHWSDDPRVDAKLLRRALDDVIALDVLTPSIAEAMRTEYYSCINSLDDPALRERVLDINLPTYGTFHPRTIRDRAEAGLALLKREPERSRRVLRLVFANYLAASKLPSAERAKRLAQIGGLTLYTSLPGDEPPISADELSRWVDSTRYAKAYLFPWTNIERALTRDEQARASLIVHLAEQLHLREKGRAPTSAEELVGPYLKALPTGYAPPVAEPKTTGAPR